MSRHSVSRNRVCMSPVENSNHHQPTTLDDTECVSPVPNTQLKIWLLQKVGRARCHSQRRSHGVLDNGSTRLRRSRGRWKTSGEGAQELRPCHLGWTRRLGPTQRTASHVLLHVHLRVAARLRARKNFWFLGVSPTIRPPSYPGGRWLTCNETVAGAPAARGAVAGWRTRRGVGLSAWEDLQVHTGRRRLARCALGAGLRSMPHDPSLQHAGR